MQTRNNVHTIRLFDLLAIDGGEQFFESIANSFMSKNADVEQFFRKKAVQATKLNTAATYLVISYENKKFYLLGYFTLATKMLTLKQDSLSKIECKAISRFGYFDEDSLSYKLPAVLIAQFSRNFNESSKSISGDDLMDIALDKIKDVLHSTSGKAVFLECEQKKSIIEFYMRNNFQPLGNTILSKDNKELTQLYIIL
ncbi:MAG: hypothetical protein IJJ71_13310 [Treponema sp.]|uniref:hypothetical protein n=1 Tax=Treponema sp. TaxID=166 RepID=UPI0025F31C69|nr:hypothetical protein [Treponema sp.]MBR0497136.1 hypothetical protein [Treponema sp.]